MKISVYFFTIDDKTELYTVIWMKIKKENSWFNVFSKIKDKERQVVESKREVAFSTNLTFLLGWGKVCIVKVIPRTNSEYSNCKKMGTSIENEMLYIYRLGPTFYYIVHTHVMQQNQLLFKATHPNLKSRCVQR